MFQVRDLTDLAEVKQILEDGDLPELEAVGDGVAHHEGRHQVLDRPRLPAVRPEGEGLEAPLFPQLVEDGQVDEGVVEIVGVGRVLLPGPLVWSRNITVEHRILGLGLVVHRVKPADVLQELVQVRVGAGVDGHLEERLEETLDDVLETVDTVVDPVDVVQSRNLDHPPTM